MLSLYARKTVQLPVELNGFMQSIFRLQNNNPNIIAPEKRLHYAGQPN